MNLRGKTVLVTGAAGALGQAVSKKASTYGAKVIGLDIVDSPRLECVEEYRKVDLLSAADTQNCIEQLHDIDALLNIAGGFDMGASASDASDEQWDSMFNVNVTTMRNATRAVVPGFLEQGRGSIVNIGALSALSGAPSMSAYCCAKSAVMRLTESLSEELKTSGINVNAVLPSIIDTPANRDDMPDANFADWVPAEKLAEVICFLASDSASAIHGALLPVKGLV